MTTILISSLLVALFSALGVELFRRACLKYQWYDVPNERSSHVVPTPRGGGLAVVIVLGLFAITAGKMSGYERLPLILAPSLVIAALGFIDDRRGISAGIRLLVQLLSALVSFLLMDHLIGLDETISILGFTLNAPIAIALGVLFTTWMTNLYNFMDGIDGIEALQVVTVGLLAAALSLRQGSPELIGAFLALVAGALGFLVWNWHPARIFMGDVASGFFGFILAVLAVFSVLVGGLSIEIALILHAAFLADTFYTLVRRTIGGEKPYQAHRSHAYQKLTQMGHSHSRVSLAYGAVNLLWLGPLAFVVQRETISPILGLVLAYVPLFFVCYMTRAGTKPASA